MNKAIKGMLFFAGLLLTMAVAGSMLLAAADDTIPGVSLPATPVSGDLAQGTDDHDVYSVDLQEGQTFQVSISLTSGDPATTDFDLYLYAPGSTDINTAQVLAQAISSTYPDGLSYAVPGGGAGTYYLDVEAFSGTGNYQLDYTIVASNPDDNIPGVALPASPVSGDLNKAMDDHDVYQINLQEGSTFQATLDGDAATSDFDLHLFGPGSTDVYTSGSLTDAISGSYPDGFSYTVPAGGAGTYYLDVEAFSGTGNYQIAFTITNPAPPPDTTPPSVTNVMPTGTINTADNTISADYADTGSGINTGSVSVSLDGAPLTCTATATGVSCPVTGLGDGLHTISGSVADNAGNSSPISGSFTVDATGPAVSNVMPTGTINTADNTISADYADTGSGINTGSVRVFLDGSATALTCTVTATNVSCPVSGLGDGLHTISGSVADNAGNSSPISGSFTVDTAVADTTPPTVSNVMPTGTISNNAPTVSADYADNDSGINTGSVSVSLDGAPLTCNATATGVTCGTSGLTDGNHAISGSVADNAGNSSPISGSFTVQTAATPPENEPPANTKPARYFFPWYDSAGMRNWVLMSNPAGSGRPNLEFDLNIAKATQNLGNGFGLGAGIVPPGRSLTPIYPGLMGGPVVVTSQTGDKAIVSQRSLMGNSFEEVLGIEESRLSDHYVWTWYDETPGMQDWVLIANPDANQSVYYEIWIAGNKVKDGGPIAPGANDTPRFAGVMGGPVEVKAFADSFHTIPAKVAASQRVLSGGGSAFNEQSGTPYGELSDRYLWTWYDSAGGRNWILIANPTDAGSDIYYEIRIGNGAPISGGPIAPGGNATPIFPGVMGGPVEVKTFSDAGHTAPAKSIASQRILWGPSFGEVPGLAAGSLYSALASDYHWTWYDSAGGRNWILIANPADATSSDIYYEIKIGNGAPISGGPIAPGGNATPIFPGVMGGPVEVKTFHADGSPANSIASQRVLWNGYFNELLGAVL